MGKFNCATKISWGSTITERITAIKGQKVWLVCDGFLVDSPLLKEYQAKLSQQNTVGIFSKIVPDPPIENVIKGIQEFLAFQPDMILAVGGGSAIDTAKAIAYFVKKLQLGTLKQFIAMPTTSGTGSEVTSVAVVTDTEKNSKFPIVAEEILPDEAWLDPRFVASCPPKVAASSGLDVLTHALEALVAKDADVFTDSLAFNAAKAVFDYLPKCYQEKTAEADLMALHQASCMAGVAFQNAGLGICHAISHQLGGIFHLPHGLLNSILLPKVIAFNSQDQKAQEKYAKAARFFHFASNHDTDCQAVAKLIQEIETLKQTVDSNQLLKDFSISQQQLIESLPQIIAKTKVDFTFAGNPKVPTDQEIAKIVLSIY